MSCTLREPFEPCEIDPLQFSLRLHPKFQGQIGIKERGGVLTVACKDNASKNAFILAIQDAMSCRDLDERRFRDTSEQLERERKEGI